MIVATGDWTAPNIIQTLVAVGSLAAAFAAISAVKASNRVAKATEQLAEKTAETVALANQELRQGERQLNLARMSLQASYRPLIIGVPIPQGRSDNSFEGRIFFYHDGKEEDEKGQYVAISVPVRNIGNGPAKIISAVFFAQDVEYAGDPSSLVMAVGDKGWIGTEIRRLEVGDTYLIYRTAVIGNHDFTLKLSYTDLSTGPTYTTFFTFGSDSGGYLLTNLQVEGINLDDSGRAPVKPRKS